MRESLLLDGQDELEGRRPAGLDLVTGDRATDHVAVGVEREGAEHGRHVLRLHDVLEDLVAVVGGGLLDRREGDVGNRIPVRRVRRRVIAAVVCLVLVEPLLAGTGQLIRADATEGEERAVGGRTRAVVPGLLEHAVTGHHHDVRQRRAEILPELAGVLAGDRADVDDVGTAGLDLLGQCAVVSRLGVEAFRRLVGADNFDADLVGVERPGLGESRSVELGVVEDVGLGLALGLGPLGAGSTLRIVGRDRPSVVAVTGRVVGCGLAGDRDARHFLGQARIRVGRADHDQAGLVEERDGQLGGAGVVGPDVDHGVRIRDRLVGVLLLDGAVPVAVVGGRRVVEVEVLDRPVADLHAVERLLDLLDHRVGLLGIRALARQARIHVDLSRARALLVLADGGLSTSRSHSRSVRPSRRRGCCTPRTPKC